MSRRLHIAYINADRGVPAGGAKGASAHVCELARALAESGAEVRVLAARAVASTESAAFPTPVIDLSAARALRLTRQALFARATTARAQAQAAEAYALVLNAFVERALDRLHRRWGIDAIYERYALWSYAGALFARTAGIPHVLEVNAPLRIEQARYRTLVNAAAAASFETLLFSLADALVVPSTALREYVTRQGVAPARVCVLPNAADPHRFRPPPHPPRVRAGDPCVVGFVGSLKPWHGIDVLLRAFARLHRRFAGYRLRIAGDGPLRPALERAIRRQHLTAVVELVGEVDHDAVAEFLAGVHVAVAPYPKLPQFYFSPLKVFEYMAAGVPVVASDIGQLGELFAHGTHLLLHRPGAIDEIVAHIETLRQRPALAARLAREARRLVCRRFTWRRNAARVIALIRRAKRRSRSRPQLATRIREDAHRATR